MTKEQEAIIKLAELIDVLESVAPIIKEQSQFRSRVELIKDILEVE